MRWCCSNIISRICGTTATTESKCPPGKKLVIKQKLDPSILGGYVAECNNTVLDSSVKSKLQKVRGAVCCIQVYAIVTQVEAIIQSPAFQPVLREVFLLP